MTRPARFGMCASCIEDRDTHRCVRKGRTVWLCEDCETFLGALSTMADLADTGSGPCETRKPASAVSGIHHVPIQRAR